MAKNALAKVAKNTAVKAAKKAAKKAASPKAKDSGSKLTWKNIAWQGGTHLGIVGAKNLLPAEIMGKSSAYFIELPAAVIAAGVALLAGKKAGSSATSALLGVGHAVISRLDSSRAIAIVVGKGGEVHKVSANGDVTEVGAKKAG